MGKIYHRMYNALGDLMYRRYLHRLMSDEFYIRTRWRKTMGYELDLKKPQLFNEKLQWLKLYDRNPLYPTLVDKCEVKKWIAERIGEQYVIPTLAVYNSVDEIDLDALPNTFVLKCTHDSGSVVLCKDKSSFDLDAAKKKLNARMHYNYYWNAREWPYKHLKPRIIAEELMGDDSEHNKGGLSDYKFTCFNGVAENVMACVDRNEGDTKFFFYDRQWNLLPLNIRGKNTDSNYKLPKPACMDEMFEIASILSEGIPFLRVDMYCVNEKPYVGELTFFPSAGFDVNLLPATERLFGKMIDC